MLTLYSEQLHSTEVLASEGKICKFTRVCTVSLCRETGIKYKIILAKPTNISLEDEYLIHNLGTVLRVQ
jgi:hypothetical protein